METVQALIFGDQRLWRSGLCGLQGKSGAEQPHAGSSGGSRRAGNRVRQEEIRAAHHTHPEMRRPLAGHGCAEGGYDGQKHFPDEIYGEGWEEGLYRDLLSLKGLWPAVPFALTSLSCLFYSVYDSFQLAITGGKRNVGYPESYENTPQHP